ncbi:fiber 2 [Psittacine aviadenovirus B]|uniref:Fiber 2 n=1 Tax=psittacine adenovirus 4 TaxID=2773287 RepID=A0A1P8SW84_9ADEN|nr:fiber 2 [Psittacine aviadenovirus B]APY28364.1 fiber 2 [psittacine adenovirus 4]
MESGLNAPKRRTPVATLREEPAPKRHRIAAASLASAGSGSVNLVYPFWYNVSPPELNPPFLDSSGPLYEQDGRLALRLSNPITEQNRSVALNYDTTTLGLTSAGELTVQVDPEGPLDASNDGLTVKVDGITIEVDQDWDLAVKTDPEGPIQANGSQGLSINVDDTLLIAQDPSSQQYELGLNLSTAGPLTADENGLDIEYDQQSMQLLSPTGTSSGPLLAVKLKPGGGLQKGADGLFATVLSTDSGQAVANVTASPPLSVDNSNISLAVDPNTLQTGSGVLGVNLKDQGGLQTGTSGIGVAVDQSLTVTNNTVEVKPDSTGPVYLSSNGVNVRTDNETVNITNGTNGPQLSVALDPRGCLVSLANVIKLMYKTTLDIQNNFLTVKLKPNGGLSSDENGIYLTNTALASAAFEETFSPSGGSVVRLSSGDPLLRTVCSNVYTNQGVKFPCSYYLLQTNCDGLLTTVLTLRLQAEQLADRTSYNKETTFFTFWVTASSSSVTTDSPTDLQAPELSPKTATPDQLSPLVQRLGAVSPLSLTAETFGGDKYTVCGKGFINQTKNPYLDAQIAPVRLANESSAIVFLFSVTPETCLFDPDAQGDIILGPVSYCCPAKVADSSA